MKIYRSLFLLSLIFLSSIFLLASPLEARISLDMSFFNQDQQVVEFLRLRVPKDSRQAWLIAEKGSWEPWLAKQNGFFRRKIFWDPKREEGVLLISWSSREEWKSISEADLEFVQNQFEQLARESLGQVEGNPFPLLYEGELIPE